ncbi:hypothetical protein [Streptomyces fractus]|uniref:hypothetical protein n=1 Tax=Streptomyces fractus TaxID=641806 RepID=UPI003CF79C7D
MTRTPRAITPSMCVTVTDAARGRAGRERVQRAEEQRDADGQLGQTGAEFVP